MDTLGPLVLIAIVLFVLTFIGVATRARIQKPATQAPTPSQPERKEWCLGYAASNWAVGDLQYQDGKGRDLWTRERIPSGWYRIVRRAEPHDMPAAVAIGSCEIYGIPSAPPVDLTADEQFLQQVHFPRRRA